MRALTREVQDAVFAMIKPLIPPPKPHPLGCHRPRVPDRLCFRGILYRLTTGSSWEDIEAILDFEVSDTTLRARRDEWIAAGVFDEIHAEAVDALNKAREAVRMGIPNRTRRGVVIRAVGSARRCPVDVPH